MARRVITVPQEAAAAIHLAAVDPADRDGLIAGLRSELTAVAAGRPADCTTATDTTRRAVMQLLVFGADLRCGQRLNVSFAEDQQMIVAAGLLRHDKRVHQVVRLTQQRMFEDLRIAYADDPGTIRDVSPDDLPAMLDLTAADGVDAKALAGDLAKTLPDVERTELERCVAVPHPVVPR